MVYYFCRYCRCDNDNYFLYSNVFNLIPFLHSYIILLYDLSFIILPITPSSLSPSLPPLTLPLTLPPSLPLTLPLILPPSIPPTLPPWLSSSLPLFFLPSLPPSYPQSHYSFYPLTFPLILPPSIRLTLPPFITHLFFNKVWDNKSFSNTPVASVRFPVGDLQVAKKVRTHALLIPHHTVLTPSLCLLFLLFCTLKLLLPPQLFLFKPAKPVRYLWIQLSAHSLCHSFLSYSFPLSLVLTLSIVILLTFDIYS